MTATDAKAYCDNLNATLPMFKEPGKYKKLKSALNFGPIVYGLEVTTPYGKYK